jgi:hypothetical protein
VFNDVVELKKAFSFVVASHGGAEVYFGSSGRIGDVLSFNPTVEWQINSMADQQ